MGDEGRLPSVVIIYKLEHIYLLVNKRMVLTGNLFVLFSEKILPLTTIVQLNLDYLCY